jgi:hypothetical protein
VIRKIFLIVVLAAVLPCAATAQSSKYGSWKQGGGDSGQLLQELKKLIDEAERSRAADPRFIWDLRSLMRRHGNPWQVSLLSETFSDGDYTRNPAWTVASGKFEVPRQGGLMSDVSSYASQNDQGSSQGQSRDDVALQLLGALLNKNSQSRNTESRYDRGPAEIYLPLRISNSFSIRADIGGRGEGGAFELRVFQGQRRLRGYALAYNEQSGLTLIDRHRGRNAGVIESVRMKKSLLDGVEHRLEWSRDQAGEMVVKVDDKEVMRVVDGGFRDPFEGIRMVNGGGQLVLFGLHINGTK